MLKWFLKKRGNNPPNDNEKGTNTLSLSEQNITCTFIGDPKVGKTCMLLSYIQTKGHESFLIDYVPTAFKSYGKKLKHESSTISLYLYDNGGNKECSQYRPEGSIGTDIFLLCFAIDDPNSFDNISEKWIKEIRENYAETSFRSSIKGEPIKSSGSKPLIMLVGCKSDTRNALSVFNTINESKRKNSSPDIRKNRKQLQVKSRRSHSVSGSFCISPGQAEQLRDEIGAYRYMECSSKSRVGISKVFEEIVKEIISQRKDDVKER